MLFNSFEYPFFLLLVVVLYYSLSHRYRWLMLLTASYYFYASWQLEYVVLIAISTLIDYICALGMQHTKRPVFKRYLLITSICSNLGILFAFKYADFFSHSLRQAFAPYDLFQSLPELAWIMPIGLSFYTLQTIGYSIDVYRGKRQAERHLGLFALYVSFFPQLVAGPIERSTRLLPQFYNRIYFDIDKIRIGVLLILWGFFKKLVIADQLSIYIDTVYGAPEAHGAPALAIATYAAVFRMYCDFSGYTDIARGSAMLMGIDLMENFKRPYAASSIRLFWQRWHISLTQWVFDYLYYPLLRKHRNSAIIKALGLLLVFGLIGFWHGANWTFILFGLYYGVLFILSDWIQLRLKKNQNSALLRAFKWLWDNKVIGILLTFHILWFAVVLFTSSSLDDAMVIYKKLFSGAWNSATFEQALMHKYQLVIALTGIVIMEWVQWLHARGDVYQRVLRLPLVFRWGVYYCLFYTTLMFGNLELRAFQYFQF